MLLKLASALKISVISLHTHSNVSEAERCKEKNGPYGGGSHHVGGSQISAPGLSIYLYIFENGRTSGGNTHHYVGARVDAMKRHPCIKA